MSNAVMATPAIKELGINVSTGGQFRDKRILIKDTSGANNTEEIKAQRVEAFKGAKKEIARCAHNIGASFYAMGQALKEIRDRELWKEGKAKKWHEFAASISGVTYATVCNLISVVENLTPEVASKLGPTIAYAVARAPGKDCQDELIKLASTGATVKQVHKVAKQQRKAAGTDKPRKQGSKPKGASKAVKKDLESKESAEQFDEKVSVVGTGEIKLKRGKGVIEVDGVTIEVKLTGKTKLEYVARLA